MIKNLLVCLNHICIISQSFKVPITCQSEALFFLFSVVFVSVNEGEMRYIVVFLFFIHRVDGPFS